MYVVIPSSVRQVTRARDIAVRSQLSSSGRDRAWIDMRMCDCGQMKPSIVRDYCGERANATQKRNNTRHRSATGYGSRAVPTTFLRRVRAHRDRCARLTARSERNHT